MSSRLRALPSRRTASFDPSVERQLKMLGSEVVRLAEHFAVQESPDHATECARARDRVAAAV